MADPPISKYASWDLQPICPQDMFERLQDSMHQPEDYNHLLARTLQRICQALSTSEITWYQGTPYLKDPDREKFLSANRPTLQSAYYGLNQKDRYLRMSGVTTAGNQGFLVPKPATITGLWAKSRSIGNWIIEARKNGNPITLVSVNITGSFGSDMLVDIDVEAGDYLQFFLNGNAVDHPIAAMEIAWRLPI